MVVLVAAESSEREGLLAFLEAHRGAVRRSVHGLTEEQARATPSASSLSLGGLLKHVTTCEQHWIESVLTGRELPQQPWEDQHRLLDGESVADWLKQYEAVAAETERVIRALPDLEVDAALPEAPWFPPNSRMDGPLDPHPPVHRGGPARRTRRHHPGEPGRQYRPGAGRGGRAGPGLKFRRALVEH